MEVKDNPKDEAVWGIFACPACKESRTYTVREVRAMGRMPRCENKERHGELYYPTECARKPDWMENGATAYGYCVERGHVMENIPMWPPRQECVRCGHIEVRDISAPVFENPSKCQVCGIGCAEHLLSDGVGVDGAGNTRPVLVCPKCRPTYGVKSRREQAAASEGGK